MPVKIRITFSLPPPLLQEKKPPEYVYLSVHLLVRDRRFDSTGTGYQHRQTATSYTLCKQIQPRNLTVLISISSQCANLLQPRYICTVWLFYLDFVIFYFTSKTRETINVSGLLFQGLKKQHPFTQSHSKSD